MTQSKANFMKSLILKNAQLKADLENAKNEIEGLKKIVSCYELFIADTRKLILSKSHSFR